MCNRFILKFCITCNAKTFKVARYFNVTHTHPHTDIRVFKCTRGYLGHFRGHQNSILGDSDHSPHRGVISDCSNWVARCYRHVAGGDQAGRSALLSGTGCHPPHRSTWCRMATVLSGETRGFGSYYFCANSPNFTKRGNKEDGPEGVNITYKGLTPPQTPSCWSVTPVWPSEPCGEVGLGRGEAWSLGSR